MTIETNKNEQNEMIDSEKLIADTITKVEGLLNIHYPDHLAFGNGQFTILHGSTQVMIIVRPFTDNDTCVECISQLVTGAKVNEELMKFLLRKNAELHYGAFGMLFDDTITFSHAITGANLDENEFLNTLNSVAIIADYYDDILVNMAGGSRISDLHEMD